MVKQQAAGDAEPRGKDHVMTIMTRSIVRAGFLFATLVLAARPTPAEDLPPAAEGAKERLSSSPRHSEYVKVDAGNGDSVKYGSSPETALLSKVKAPVLGLYGADDARVNETIPAAEAEMKKLGKTFEHEIYPGAGHGFLRQQDGRDGANAKAAKQAWPRTIAFLRKHLAE